MSNKTDIDVTLGIKTVNINPEAAQALLCGHTNYRKPSTKRILAYSREMTAGRWGLSILIVDETGELCDGQNRLLAIIESGCTCKFAIVEGWPKLSVPVLDNNQTRTKSQVAEAVLHIKNTNRVMALASAIEDPTGRALVLNSEAVELYKKHCQLIDVLASTATSESLKSAVHLAAFARAILAIPSRRGDILDSLRKMNSMDFAEPRMSGLRLYFSWAIVRGFSRGGSDRRWEAYRRCARAIEAYLAGEKIEKLYCPANDPFDRSVAG
jgi:hypothetical protein